MAIGQESNQACEAKREWRLQPILLLILTQTKLYSRGRSLPRTYDGGRLRLRKIEDTFGCVEQLGSQLASLRYSYLGAPKEIEALTLWAQVSLHVHAQTASPVCDFASIVYTYS